MRKYKKRKISSILAALLIVSLLAPSFGNLSLAAEETSSEYDTQIYKVICTETWDFEDEAQMEDFDLYRSSNLSIQDGILKTAGRWVGTKAMVKTPFKSDSVKSVSVDIIPGTSGHPVDAAILLGASDVDADETTMNALAFVVESNYTGWEDAPNRIDLVTGSFPWAQHDRLISETGSQNALYENGEKKPLTLKLDFADDGITATLSLVGDSSKYVQTTYSCDTSEIVGQIGLRAHNSDVSFDNLRIEYSKTASGQQAVFEGQVTYAAGSTIIMDMKGTNASGDVSGELFKISDDGMAIGGHSCAGTFDAGEYGVKAFLNPTQESVLVEVTLPNGGIIRRGSSSLLYGCTSITEIVASWCGIENPVTGKVTYEDINVQEYTVNTTEPEYTGFDKNVYNLVSSFDKDAKTTRNFAWTALKSFVGDDKMAVQYRQQGTDDWTTVNAVQESGHSDGILTTGRYNWKNIFARGSYDASKLTSVSVDIIPGESARPMDVGIYLGATNIGTSGVNNLSALGFVVQSYDTNNLNYISLRTYEFNNNESVKSVVASDGTGENALYSNGKKEPVNLKLDFYADRIVATLSLIEDPSKYIQTEYACTTSEIKGQIGLRLHECDASVDNFTITSADGIQSKSWDFSDESQINDFTKIDAETDRDFQFIQDGILKTTARYATTLKTVLKTKYASNSVKTLSVDIIPSGDSAYMSAVVWLGTTGVTSSTSAKSLAFRVESVENSGICNIQAGLYDGVNWVADKGGLGNIALFSGTKKEPLTLKLDFYADKIVATLSLRDNPDNYAQWTCEYDTSTIAGQVVLHPWHSDVSFDTLKIETLQTIQPDTWDFSTTSQLNDFTTHYGDSYWNVEIKEAKEEAYFKADVTTLTAGTTYEYRIGKETTNEWSSVYSFTTEAETVDEFSFVAIGDTEASAWDNGYMYTQAVLNQVASKEPAFILNTGDAVMQGETLSQWNQYFKALGDVGKTVPYFTAIGDKDIANSSDNFDLHFNHPNNGGMSAYAADIISTLRSTGTYWNNKTINSAVKSLLSNLDETTYSFDYGKAHVVVLNTGYDPSAAVLANIDQQIIEAQRAWFEADLQANTDAEWTIVMLHQPVYHVNEAESKPWFYDIIEANGVDLVLQGDSHLVSRTYPMKGGAVASTTMGDAIVGGTGTVYMTLGSTAANHDVVSDSIADEIYTVFSPEANQPTYTTVTVKETKMVVTVKQVNGLVVDEFTIMSDNAELKKFSGATLDLEGKIGLNFYVNNGHALTDKAYVEFALPNETKQTVALKDAAVTKYGLKFTCQVAAKQMTDTVTATLYDGGMEQDTKSYSVRDYAEALITNTSQVDAYTQATPLMKEMLTYGAYSQILFNYNTADLANKNYVADDKVAKIDKNDLAAYSKGAQGLAGFGQLAGGTLVLESETTLKLFFTFDSEVDLNGLNFTVNGKACDYMQDDNYYVVECKNITAKDLDKDYKVAVKIGNETKFEAVASAMTFCYNALNNASQDVPTQNVSKALYFYNDAANCYMQGKTVTLSDNYNVISGALSDSSVKGFGIQDGKLVSSLSEGESKIIYKQSVNNLQSISVDVYPGKDGEFHTGIYLGASNANDALDGINAATTILRTRTEQEVPYLDLYNGYFTQAWNADDGWKAFEDVLTNGQPEPLNLQVSISGADITVKITSLSDSSKTGSMTYRTKSGIDVKNGQVGLRWSANKQVDAADYFDNFTVTDSNGTKVVEFNNSDDMTLFDFYQSVNIVTEGVVTVQNPTLALHKTEKFVNGRFLAELNTYKANKAAGIVFGADEDGTNYYLYRLTADRFVELVKVQDGTETVLDRGFLSAGHWNGGFNRLEVVREGNNIYCYYYNQFDIVNCYAVYEDAEPLTGTGIGLWSETPGVSYRNVTVSHPREIRKADVLIFGHSYTEMWGSTYKNYFQEYQSIDNIGIGGSTAAHWEELADEVIAYEPKLGIYDIGINDLGGTTPKAVVDSIKTTVSTIKEALPEFEVVLVSVSHCPSRTGQASKIAETNAWMRSLAAEYDWIYYSEQEYLFCTTEGDATTTDAQYFLSDNLHPSAAGYEKMAESIKSALGGENQPTLLKYDFEDASQINDFTLTNPGTNNEYQGIADGMLKTKVSHSTTMKAVLNTLYKSNSVKTLSVDIIPSGDSAYMSAVVWLGAFGVTSGTSPKSLAFRVESPENSGIINLQRGYYDGVTWISEGGRQYETLYNGTNKEPLTLRLDFYADRIVATLSLRDNPDSYEQYTHECNTSTIAGHIVLHPWHSMASFDNLAIVYLPTNEDKEDKDDYVFAETETYKNHIEVEGQWEDVLSTGDIGDVGIGDPFVMRFDGKYYMYPSSGIGGDNPGIKVYESEDLINWTYKGFAANDPILSGAYAPEVVYYNGLFYMATSPNGNGHYILVGDNPLGPFEIVTENFGCNIDGAFYVGDDGGLFFLYAGGGSSIKIASMDEETMRPGNATILNATLNGWTEGPGLFRRGDVLYLTYTGNHVHSKGYRVGYSYSMGEDPMGSYVLPQDNIILLHAGEGSGSFAGLGHSSNVIGPNLDSWYTAYHNLYEGSGKPRRLMIDQLVTNGAMLLANGPTYSEVAVPKRPDYETRDVTDGFLSDESTEEIYTIEYNVTPTETSNMEFVFAYKDAKNYTAVRWSMPNETMTLVTVNNGKETEIQSADMKGIKADKLHTVRIEKGADKMEVYADSMQKIEASSDGIGAGKIGVKGEATYSYTAFTNDAYGTSDFESIKNLPSSFPAVHYLKGENRGWSIKNATDVAGGIRQNEAENTVKNEDDAISALVLDTENDWVKYAVNATEESYYGIAGTVTTDSAGAVIQVIVDEEEVYTFTVPEAGNVKDEYAKLMLGEIPLTAGNHTLKIKLCSGKLQVQVFDIQPTNPTEDTYENAMNKLLMNEGWSYTGNWVIEDGAHVVEAGEDAFAYAGNDKMTDFSMEVDVALLEDATSYDGGILFHAKNHSTYASQVAESLQGYYLAICNNQITLKRYNYGGDTLASVDVALTKDEYHKVKIEMINNHILVYLDNMDTPIIDCYDSRAFLSGQIALCSYKAGIAFKNIIIITK